MGESFTARARLRAAALLIAGLAGACGGGGGASASPPAPAPSPPPPAPPPPPPPPTTTLKGAYQNAFAVGAAIQASQVQSALDEPLLRAHFTSITAEYEMKADIIGPSAGVYNFAPGDALVNYAQNNGMQVRGHALLWHQTTPAWFLAGGDPATIQQRLETYITAVVTRYRGKVQAWDVVNEVVSDDAGVGIGYRNSNWLQAVGPDYIEWAFRAARAADPNVKLFINEYGTESAAKRARFMAILGDLRAKNVPIDGVGHQMHVNLSVTAADADAALAAVDGLNAGLDNHVTELDISLYNDPGSCFSSQTGCQTGYGLAPPQSVLSDQARLYRALFNAFRARASVKSVTTWGISDAQSWLNTFPVTRANHPLLFDRDRAPKSALYAVVDPSFAIP